MTAFNNEWVNTLAKQFNESQKAYKVTPIYKGSYDESMTAAIAAFRAGNAPHILQVFEVGTATMMASKGAIVPAGKVMADAGKKFDPNAYVAAVAGYYTAPNGQMLSFPYNSSTTVFYYNKDAFKAAGLDPEKAPTTWPEMALAARQAQGQRPQVPADDCLAGLDAAGELLGLAQRRVRDQEQRPGRHGRAPGVQLAAARAPHREPGQHGQAGPVHLQGPPQRARAGVHQRRVRDDDHLHRLLRQRQAERQVRLGPGHAALLPRRARRAAEHRDRRRQPVDDGRQEARRVQGRGRVLRIHLAARDRRQDAPGHRLPAGDQRRVPADREVGLLQEQPGHRCRPDADDPQGHRQVARHPPGQLRADPRHRGRRTRAGLGRQEEREGSARLERQARQRAAGTLRESEQGPSKS